MALILWVIALQAAWTVAVLHAAAVYRAYRREQVSERKRRPAYLEISDAVGIEIAREVDRGPR